MDKHKESPVVSDGKTTPSKLKDLEERFGLIEQGESIETWEKRQLLDRAQNTFSN